MINCKFLYSSGLPSDDEEEEAIMEKEERIENVLMNFFNAWLNNLISTNFFPFFKYEKNVLKGSFCFFYWLFLPHFYQACRPGNASRCKKNLPSFLLFIHNFHL